MFNHLVMRKRSKFLQLKNIKLEASPLHITCLYPNFVAFAAASLAAFALAIQRGFGLVMALQAKIALAASLAAYALAIQREYTPQDFSLPTDA